MIRLNLLSNDGFSKKRKRVGRGIGSGRGKTSCRGVKGQKSRAGVSINGFEGGQQSFITALPKRGFNSNSSRKKYVKCFNISKFQEMYISGHIKNGDVIDNKMLHSLKLIKNEKIRIKILGYGNLSINLKFKVNAVTASAKQIIENVGGYVEIKG